MLLVILYTDAPEDINIGHCSICMSTAHIRNNVNNALHVDNFINPIFASVNIIVIVSSNMYIEFCSTTLYSNVFYLGHRPHVSKEPFFKKIIERNIENANVHRVPRRSLFL